MDPLRNQLLDTLKGGQAHADFQSAIKNLPAEYQGKKPEGAPHTAWQLLEHLRIAQSDILDFSTDPNYVEQKWPDDYWPLEAAPPTPQSWNESVAAFEKDHKEFAALISKTGNDLFAKLPNGDGQTLLREALLIIDHNAYHIGQLVLLRTQLGIWPL
jgi:uncharacterized damage-inducible protein DinB